MPEDVMEADADLERRLRIVRQSLELVSALLMVAYLLDVMTHGEIGRIAKWRWQQVKRNLASRPQVKVVPWAVQAAEQHLTEVLRTGGLAE